MDVCADCNLPLGKLEPAHLVDGRVLCIVCFRKKTLTSDSEPVTRRGIPKTMRLGCLIVLALFVTGCLLSAIFAPDRPKPRGLATTSPGMIYEQLRSRGYSVSKDIENDFYAAEKRIGTTRYLVEIFGRPTSVRRINAVVSTTIDKQIDPIARNELLYIASVDYEGAEPDLAVQWVRENLGRNLSASFGGATFELRATPTSRSLFIH